MNVGRGFGKLIGHQESNVVIGGFADKAAKSTKKAVSKGVMKKIASVEFVAHRKV
jgi:hypothetical protein